MCSLSCFGVRGENSVFTYFFSAPRKQSGLTQLALFIVILIEYQYKLSIFGMGKSRS